MKTDPPFCATSRIVNRAVVLAYGTAFVISVLIPGSGYPAASQLRLSLAPLAALSGSMHRIGSVPQRLAAFH